MFLFVLIALVVAVASFLVLRRVWPRGHRGPLVAACLVLGSSTYALFTKPPESFNFRFHVALLIAMVVAVMFRSFKGRSAAL